MDLSRIFHASGFDKNHMIVDTPSPEETKVTQEHWVLTCIHRPSKLSKLMKRIALESKTAFRGCVELTGRSHMLLCSLWVDTDLFVFLYPRCLGF